MLTALHHRLVVLEGASNFRDLGGYRTDDGRIVRSGHLYRADGLDTLTSEDLAVLRTKGLRTVIDLRSSHEIDERGRFPHERHPVAWHHLSVLDKTWDRNGALKRKQPASEFLVEAYSDMLVEGAPRFAAAFGLLARDQALPAVFHCAAGKDRTGLLAALLLGALGVPNEAIVHDYALTELAMPAFLERMANRYPDRQEEMAAIPPGFFSATPQAMADTLTHLEADYGSIEAYLLNAGVSPGTLKTLNNRLTEPS